MVSAERKAQLEQRLQAIGIERLLADQGQSFINTIGGPPDDRVYAGEWLRRAIAKRNNTMNSRLEGKRAMRRDVANALYGAVDGKHNVAVLCDDLAEHMNLESEAVGDALDYLEGEGLVEQVAMGSYGLTHRGIKEVEQARERPEHPTSHFPAMQVINNFGGNQVVAQGHDILVNQFTSSTAPAELQQLIEELRLADGGSLSHESTAFLRAAQDGSKLKIAATAEEVVAKSDKHASIIAAFKEALAKKIAEKSVDGAIHGLGWLCEHGPQVVAALALLHHQ